MGIDVNLYVEVDVSDEEVAVAEEFMQARVGYLSWGDDDVLLQRLNGYDGDETRIEVSTGERYYGPGYERGNWPQIYGGIMALKAAFPTGKVFYGGDTSNNGYEATEEALAEIWAHFLGAEGDSYRAYWRAKSAAVRSSSTESNKP